MNFKSSVFYTSLYLFLSYLPLNLLNAQPINNYINDVVLPPPEAGSLGKYGDIPVSYYTGVPDISIPIYTVSDGPLSLPVSLSYHAAGISVSETASRVGIGWALNAGGIVSRTVMGIKDEYTPFGYYYTPIPDPEDDCAFGEYIWNAGSGQADSEPDIFSFNISGYTGKFYLNPFLPLGDQAVLIPEQDIKILPQFTSNPAGAYHLQGFIIIPPDGTKYYLGDFDSNESTSDAIEVSQFGGNAPKVSTGWYLKKIESYDGYNSIEFEYEDEALSYYNRKSCNDSQQCGIFGNCSTELNMFWLEGKRLSKIITSTEEINFYEGAVREDVDVHPFLYTEVLKPKVVDRIEISTGSFCKKFDLGYDYFEDGLTYPAVYNVASCKKRLQLLSVQEMDCSDNITVPPYSFEYVKKNGENFLPNRLSRAVDHWGFYNGVHSNNDWPTILNIPYTEGWYEINGQVWTEYYNGDADRDTYETPMEYGVIEKINYPTGGYTIFDFEANSYHGTEIEEVTDQLYHVNHAYPIPGICGTATTVGNDIIFESSNIADLDYEIKGKASASCNCNPPEGEGTQVWMDIKVYVGSTEVMNWGNTQLPCDGTEYTSSGKLLDDIFPDLDPDITYRFEIVGRNLAAYFKITHTYEVTNHLNVKVGGLRVKQITSSGDDGFAPDMVKNYVYEGSIPGQSSGILYHQPKYWFGYTVENLGGPDGCGEPYPGLPAGGVLFFDYSIVSLGSFEGYHIGYSRVVESSSGSGQTIYSYKTEQVVELFGFPIPPELARIKAGKLHSATSLKENQSGPGSIISSETHFEYPDDYTYSTETMFTVMQTPMACPSPTTSTVAFYNFYSIRTRPYREEQIVKILDGVETTTDYEYDSSDHLFPTAESFTNSDDKVHRTEYSYIFDYTGCTAIKNLMIEANRIATPFQTELKVDNVLVSGSRTDFSFYDANGLPQNCSQTSEFPKPYQYFNYEMTFTEQNNPLSGTWELAGTINEYHGPGTPGESGYPKKFTKENWEPEFYEWENGRISSRTFEDFVWSYGYIGGTKVLSSITDIDGQTVTYEYDDLMRLKKTRARSDNVITDYTYGYAGTLGTHNFVKSKTTFTPVTNSELTELTNYQYFDGLGKLMQSVKQNYSPDNKDVVEGLRYDAGGRVIQSFIPIEGGAGGAYFQIPSGTPAALTAYEASPLSRVISQSPPGGYATAIEYEAGGGIVDQNTGNSYPANSLYVQKITDPNLNHTYVFTDKIGRTLLNKVIGFDQITAETYTAYDDKSRVRLVVPPEATNNDLGLIYTYLYDGADNMIKKKIPDQAAINMIYNNRDLLVFSQDGNMATQSKWMLYKYDVYGRDIKSGFYTGSTGDPNNPNLSFSQQLTETGYDGGPLPISYGKITSSQVKDLTNFNWLVTNFVYDGFGRIDHQSGNNHLFNALNAEYLSFAYDFADNVTSNNRVHKSSSSAQIEINRDFTFDHSGRLIESTHQVDNEGGVVVSENHYNERDFLIRKNLHQSPTGIFLQNVDYRYNTTGWLTKINEVDELDPQIIQDCNQEPCDELCDYTVLVPCNEVSYLIGIFHSGNELVELPNYPYACSDWQYMPAVLKADLENWMDFNGITYQSVSVSNEDGILTITILQTDLIFSYVTSYNTQTGQFTDTDFTQSNCNPVPPQPPTTPGPTKVIHPLRLKVEYNLSDIQNGTGNSTLIKVTEQSQYFLEDETTILVENISNTVVGTGTFNTGAMVNEMEIDLSDQWIYSDNSAAVISAVEQAITDELTTAGIASAATKQAFSEAVTSELGGDWDEEPTIPEEEGPVPNPDLFAMDLYYDEGNPIVGSPEQYNGNISGLRWGVAGSPIQTYGFWYDGLDRLYLAEYMDKAENGSYNADNKYGVDIDYEDTRGNIQSITRQGATGSCTLPSGALGFNFGTIDNLSYTYTAGSNKLERISESSNTDHGFKGSGGNITYDANGNMKIVGHKSMTAFYNHLNLPYSFDFGGGKSIDFLYDAAGTKLQKEVVDGSNSYVKDYVDGIEYKDGVLEAIYFEEGRVVLKNGRYLYEYSLTDHLGNSRVTFSDLNNDGAIQPFNTGYGQTLPGYSEIIQENHYYPFGMNTEGPWDGYDPDPSNLYQYNGKELNEDFGLDWNDYGARWYDASIGRWGHPDPLTEIAPNLTLYRFAFNNPILFTDLNGLFETKAEAKKYAKDNGIKTGFLSKNKIREQSDGTYAIINKKDHTFIENDPEWGILQGFLKVDSKSQSIGEKFLSLDGWIPLYKEIRTHGADEVFKNASISNLADVSWDVPRDNDGRPLIETGMPPPVGIGPGGIKTFADIMKGLQGVNVKQGMKYLSKEGKDQVAKIYRSLRENGFKLLGGRGGNTRTLHNPTTGEKIIFRKSQSGGYKNFDTISQSLGNGKNNMVFFK